MEPKGINVVKVAHGRTVAVRQEQTEESINLVRGKTLQPVTAKGFNPLLVSVDMRPATSAPTGSRVKVSLTTTIDGQKVPLPVQQATAMLKPTAAFTMDFRLEMN